MKQNKDSSIGHIFSLCGEFFGVLFIFSIYFSTRKRGFWVCVPLKGCAHLLALARNSGQAILAQELMVLLSHPSSARLLRSAFPQPHQPMGYKRQQVFQAAPSFVLPLSFSSNF